VVELYGTTKAFLDCAVDPLKTTMVSLGLGGQPPSPAIAIDAGNGKSGRQLEVSTGRAKWLVDGSGLRKVTFRGKELLLEPSVQNGAATVLYSGAIVAIIRVAGNRGFVDYYFFKDREIVKVVSSQAYAISNPRLRSCVAKKELGVDGCEQYEVNAWGRVATDSVFQSTVLRYPAEWGVLYSEESKCALVVYGSPSAARLTVGRGRFDAPLDGGCQRLELFLAVSDDPNSGEALFPLMSSPIVLCRCGDGFAAQEDRNGNGIADIIYVRDENANGCPDFDGDRWYFDADDDGTLQMVLAFQASPRTMRVYCDTVTGGPLHSNNLAAYFGDYPTDRYRFARYPQSRDKFDGCLSSWELQEPFHVYTDLDGDGLFFQGPVTEGGFVARDRITSAWGGPYLYEFLARNATLECTDLDGDGDADNVFENQRMRLPRNMRVEPFKPGNQALAGNLMQYLLNALLPKVRRLSLTPSGAEVRIAGRGGPIRLSLPWEDVQVRLNGEQARVRREKGLIEIQLPPGENLVEFKHAS